MIPTCVSSGARMVRASTSASSSQTGPSSRLRAVTQRRSAPMSWRAMNGTASPTKVIGPIAAVAAPASTATHTRAMVWVRRRCTPRATPASSPIDRALIAGAAQRARASPSSIRGATAAAMS